MTIEANSDHVTGCHALMAYLYNTSAADVVREAFPDMNEEGYLAAKADLCHHKLTTFLGSLDPWRFRRLVEIAMNRYGKQATRYAAMGEEAGYAQD